MKRIVCRVEGEEEDALRLAMIVLHTVLKIQGAPFRLAILGGPIRIDIARASPWTGIPCYAPRSFSTAIKMAKDLARDGTNALILREGWLDWECENGFINSPLEKFETLLHRCGVSVSACGMFSEKIPRAGLPRVSGFAGMKKACREAIDTDFDRYCGESLVLPYGALPAFFIEKEEDGQNKNFDVRYLHPTR